MDNVDSSETHFHPKSTQELAAQVQSVSTIAHTEKGKSHNDEYKQLRDKVNQALDQRVDEDTLSSTLNQIQKDAEDKKILAGYLEALRSQRKWDERDFNRTFNDYTSTHNLSEEEETEKLRSLQQKTIFIRNITPKQKQKLHTDFPGGNFLYHGSVATGIVKILESGKLSNIYALRKEEELKAVEEKRKVENPRHNSGYEGVSWSLNQIDALPGDRYHLAGFVASPNSVLQDDQQLVVPSRPAPYETLQISDGIEASSYYQAKTQIELIQHFSMGESHSVLSNIITLDLYHNDPNNLFAEYPSILTFVKNHSEEEIARILRQNFTVDGQRTTINPDLVQQQWNEKTIPPGAVWLQMLIDTGRIKQIPGLENTKSVKELVANFNETTYKALVPQIKLDAKHINDEIEKEEAKIKEISVDVENMYFVVSNKDLGKWLRILARCDKQPKGILVYDSTKVRLENFASSHIGDKKALTTELKHAIPSQTNGYINYETEVLGTPLTTDVLTGSKRHVVKESALTKRKSIRKSPQGQLIIN